MIRINQIGKKGVKMLQRRNRRAAERYQEQMQAAFVAHMAEHLTSEIEEHLGEQNGG